MIFIKPRTRKQVNRARMHYNRTIKNYRKHPTKERLDTINKLALHLAQQELVERVRNDPNLTIKLGDIVHLFISRIR